MNASYLAARATRLLSVALFLALAACDDDGSSPSADVPPELLGDWTASEFVVSPVDGSPSQDLVAAGGVMRLTVRSNGELITTTTQPGTNEQSVDVGTIKGISPGVLEIQAEPGSPVVRFTYQLDAGAWTLVGTAPVDLGSGTSVQAEIRAVYRH